MVSYELKLQSQGGVQVIRADISKSNKILITIFINFCPIRDTHEPGYMLLLQWNKLIIHIRLFLFPRCNHTLINIILRKLARCLEGSRTKVWVANPGQFEEERTVSIHKVSTVDKEHHSPLGREASAVVEMKKVGIMNIPGTKRAMGLIRHENKIK